MGRYYSGDIEGKFMLAIQSSDDAEFFGVKEQEPTHTQYYADKDTLPEIEEGLEKCRQELGDNLQKLIDFFDQRQMYNDDQVATHLGIEVAQVKDCLTWYARYELGKKIYDHLQENDTCEFDADI